ncbi:MAG: hypothetical protein I4O48_15670, partial [Ralstonia sp.]|nr:hypothetical protein [Ralstonia sp.]
MSGQQFDNRHVARAIQLELHTLTADALGFGGSLFVSDALGLGARFGLLGFTLSACLGFDGLAFGLGFGFNSRQTLALDALGLSALGSDRGLFASQCGPLLGHPLFVRLTLGTHRGLGLLLCCPLFGFDALTLRPISRLLCGTFRSSHTLTLSGFGALFGEGLAFGNKTGLFGFVRLLGRQGILHLPERNALGLVRFASELHELFERDFVRRQFVDRALNLGGGPAHAFGGA